MFKFIPAFIVIFILAFGLGFQLEYNQAKKYKVEIACQRLQDFTMLKASQCGFCIDFRPEGMICQHEQTNTLEEFNACTKKIRNVQCKDELPTECKLLRINKND